MKMDQADIRRFLCNHFYEYALRVPPENPVPKILNSALLLVILVVSRYSTEEI
jgi:hypothetical protein